MEREVIWKEKSKPQVKWYKPHPTPPPPQGISLLYADAHIFAIINYYKLNPNFMLSPKMSSPKECYIIQIVKPQRSNTKLWSSWDKMSVYSTKELHNCKAESEAAGLSNGSSLKRHIFRKHSLPKLSQKVVQST